MATEPGALPAYLQISELLIRDIAAGRLADGQRLPPEREMAAEHGVSVTTLRKALADLQNRNLLDRRQGSGNTIRASGEMEGVYAYFRLELRQGGGFPTAQVLEVTRAVKPDDLPDLGSDTGFAWRIRRVRALNRLPVSAEEIWLDGRFTDRLSAEELSQSLYLYYRERLGLAILRAEDHVEVDPVPNWVPEDLGLASGEPALMVARRTWAQTNEPIEFSRSWVNTSRARYVSRIS